MSRSLNKVLIVGNVGHAPEVRVTSSGAKVTNLSIATNWRTGGEDPEERTEWHRVTLWGRLAQLAEDHIDKGDRIYLEGRLEYDSFERDGVTIPTAEIRAREIILLSSKPESVAVTA